MEFKGVFEFTGPYGQSGCMTINPLFDSPDKRTTAVAGLILFWGHCFDKSEKPAYALKFQMYLSSYVPRASSPDGEMKCILLVLISMKLLSC